MSSQTSKMVLIGIAGSVVSLDRGTGMELWRTKLKSADFVTVVADGEYIYAGTKGEVYCLDPTTGSIRWHDRLKGLGWGLVSIAVEGGSGAMQNTSLAEKRRREQAAAAAAAGAGG